MSRERAPRRTMAWTLEQRRTAKRHLDRYLEKADALIQMEAHVDAVDRMVRNAAPSMAKVYVRNVKALQASANPAHLARAIESGHPKEVLACFDFDTFWRNLRDGYHEVNSSLIEVSSNYALDQLKVKHVAKADGDEEEYTPGFNLINPHAVDEAATQRTEDQVSGLVNIQDPEAIASTLTYTHSAEMTLPQELDAIRSNIGLNEPQMEALANYRERLISEEGLSGQALQDQLDAKAYEQLTYRAGMIAQTEGQRTVNEGRELAWQEAQDKGYLLGNWMKQWEANPDCCDECAEMGALGEAGDDTMRQPDPDAEPEQSGIGEPFTIVLDDGETDDVDTPPIHPNCRCTIILVEQEGAAHEPEGILPENLPTNPADLEYLRGETLNRLDDLQMDRSSAFARYQRLRSEKAEADKIAEAKKEYKSFDRKIKRAKAKLEQIETLLSGGAPTTVAPAAGETAVVEPKVPKVTGDKLSEENLNKFRDSLQGKMATRKEAMIQEYFGEAVKEAQAAGKTAEEILPKFGRDLQPEWFERRQMYEGSYNEDTESQLNAVKGFFSWMEDHVNPNLIERAGDCTIERTSLAGTGYAGQYTENQRLIEWAGGRDGTTTLVHEYGHHMSDQAYLPSAGGMRSRPDSTGLAFFRRRTEGEELKVYYDDIKVKRDDFIDPYTGRVYSFGSGKEVMSTGIEQISKNPVKMLGKDPEHFNLILAFINDCY